MPSPWIILVGDEHGSSCTFEVSCPALLGGQNQGEHPYSTVPCPAGDGAPAHTRVIIAPKEQTLISRRHALLEPLSEGSLRVTNRSTSQPVTFPGADALGPGQGRVVLLPLR